MQVPQTQIKNHHELKSPISKFHLKPNLEPLTSKTEQKIFKSLKTHSLIDSVNDIFEQEYNLAIIEKISLSYRQIV